MTDYDLEIERIMREIRNSNAKVVGLQFPEGLKEKAVEIAERIEEETGCIAVIFVDPTYGACDTKDSVSERVGVDLLVHFGHTEFGL
ncbi:MAG: diphthamide synthesis protein [Candidatus Altiarchaeota archaeon]